MNSLPFFSIIIPVFNVERYLENCLNSIIHQSFTDFELILINDGSTDDSEKIILKFHQQYSFIKYISQNNLGQGTARNKGIEIAQGKYFWFIDSDDTIPENALTSIYKELTNEEEVDALLFTKEIVNTYEENIEKERNHGIDKGIEAGIYSADKIMKSFLCMKILPSCANKIYSAKLFLNGKCRFPGEVFFEDLAQNVSCLSSCKKIKVIREDYYTYIQRQGSTMTSACTEKHIKSIFFILDDIKAYLQKINQYEALEKYYFRLYWYQLNYFYYKFIHEGSEENVEMFIQYLDVSTSKLHLQFFVPFDDNPDQFPFVYVLSGMMENPFLKDQENRVFESLNFPEEFINTYM